MTPLARVPSLKLKLGLLIVFAIVVAMACLLVAAKLGLRLRWGALVALGISLLSVQLLARGTTAPLRAMAAAAEAMARGEHGARVGGPAVASADEVGQLARAFNTMAAEVEGLDRARQEFVADAAHELRTPLSALRAALENAVDGVGDADPAALLQQVDRLGRLADQLLDLSRLEGAGETLASEPFAVAELLAGCSEPVDVRPADLAASGDVVRLRQVVDNLLDNARRHAPGASVTVRARAAPAGGLRLEVEDRGLGLAAGEAERIFERFARADRARAPGGAGLGLAIARSVVELHGGTIRAEPATPHGCRMVVALPPGPPPPV